MRRSVPIVPTKKGLNDANAFAEQPPLSTRLSKNMRTQQSSTGRLRVSTRTGYKPYQARELLKNYLAFTEDLAHFRDSSEGDRPFPPFEGWAVQQGTGSIGVTEDGTLGPDQAGPAKLVSQLIGTPNRAEINQVFDAATPSSNAFAKVGATWVRTAGKDIVLAVYMKAGTSTQSRLVLQQGSTAGLPRTDLLITWTAGVPSLTPTTEGGGNHPSGFTDEGNGWYRIWAGITWDIAGEGTSTLLRCLILPNNADATVKTVYVWGAQVELITQAATEPTRYEPVLGRNDSSDLRKVAALASVSHLQNQLEYRRKSIFVPDKSTKTPAQQQAHAIAYDRQQNRYVLEAQAVLKYSANGELIFSISVPIADSNHVCQALHVDDSDQIYVGVTSGGDSEKAQLFCFRQGPEVSAGHIRDDAWHLLWTVDTKLYVVSIQSVIQALYTLQDDPARRKSELVVYEALDFPAGPEVAQRVATPYPSRGFRVKSDGSVVTCHGANATRGLDPTANGSDALGPWATAVGWTPQNDLNDWKSRIWTALDSAFVNGSGRKTLDDFKADEALDDGWIDTSGKNRNAYRETGTNAPTVDLRGLSGIPGVRFRRALSQYLRSNPNPGTDETNLDLHRSLIPAYDGAKFTMFVVFRPAYESTQGAVLGQVCLPSSAPMVLCANRAMSDTVANPSRGRVCLFNDTTGSVDPAVGTGAQPTDHLLESGGLVNACVATIKCGPGAGESILRFNGTDKEAGGYATLALNGTTPTSIGQLFENAAFGFFEGVVFAIYVYNELLSATDIELHEGYFANRFGIQGRLDAAHPYKITPAVGLAVPSAAPIVAGKANVNLLNHRSTILSKFSPGGELKWVLNQHSGVGFDLALDKDGHIYSFGEFSTGDDTGNVFTGTRGEKGWVRKVLDLGDSATPNAAVGNWQANLCNENGQSVSSDFAHAFWTKTDATVTAGSGVSPEGGTDDDKLNDGAAGGAGTVTHDFASSVLLDGSDYTVSLYVKQSTAASMRLKLLQQGGAGFTQVDLTFATRVVLAAFGGTTRRHRWDFEDAGGGWIRLQVSLDFKVSDSATLRVEITPDLAAAQLGTFAWGCMLERAAKASAFFTAACHKDGPQPGSVFTTLPRVDLDKFGNFYVPGPWPMPTTSPLTKLFFTCRVYSSELYVLFDLDVGALSTDNLLPGRAVKVNPTPPAFKDDNPGVARNLAGFSERFDNAHWTKVSVTVTPNGKIAPDGKATADTLDDTSGSIEGSVTREWNLELDDGEDYTFSVHLAPQDATTTRLRLEHTGGAQSTDLLLTWNAGARRAPQILQTNVGSGTHLIELEPAENGFFRASVALTYASGLGGLRARIHPDGTAANQGVVSAWGAQLERGARMTPYQRVDGRHSFAPLDLTGQPDPVALVDKLTLVTPNDDVESLLTVLPATLYEFTVVESSPTGLAPRVMRLAAIARGSLVIPDRFGEPQVPRGGSSCLDPTARYVSATSLFQRVIATDGIRSVIYQPSVDGMVRPYVAKTGSVPDKVQLWSNWRGRAVAARTADDPHAWFMGAIEDLFDWDYFTPPLRSDKAVFSLTSRAGAAPDIINTLIPYSDQAFIVGCDHALWYLPGDPLGSRAEWQLMSGITGVSFGNNSWCKDPEEQLFFFGSRGGLYTRVGGSVKPISQETIHRRLSDIDLDRFYVELFYNWREEGIHIFVMPFGMPTAVVQHFFWGRRFDEWREDEFLLPSLQPTSGLVLDGDLAKDRKLVLANGNLRLVQWDEDTHFDEGNEIQHEELFGPFDIGHDREGRWEDPTFVLSEDSTGAVFEMYGGPTAESLGPIREQGVLLPGRNTRKAARVTAAKMWLKLRSNGPGTHFAFEEGGLWASAAGRARV